MTIGEIAAAVIGYGSAAACIVGAFYHAHRHFRGRQKGHGEAGVALLVAAFVISLVTSCGTGI